MELYHDVRRVSVVELIFLQLVSGSDIVEAVVQCLSVCISAYVPPISPVVSHSRISSENLAQ